MDWNLLERVPSPEDIVRLHDVDGLELIVEDIIRGDFSSSSSSFLPPLPRDENDNNGDDDDDENKKKAKLKEKAFRLAQLLVSICSSCKTFWSNGKPLPKLKTTS